MGIVIVWHWDHWDANSERKTPATLYLNHKVNVTFRSGSCHGCSWLGVIIRPVVGDRDGGIIVNCHWED